MKIIKMIILQKVKINKKKKKIKKKPKKIQIKMEEGVGEQKMMSMKVV